MLTTNTNTLPSPPSLLRALKAGFDAIANHIYVIFFPFVLDLFLWFGPHYKLSALVRLLTAQLQPFMGTQDQATIEMFQEGKALWELAAERFNILIALRTYPVGVPSLMVARMPLNTPLGAIWGVEINSFSKIIILWLLASLVGVVIGVLFFLIVAQTTLEGQTLWRQVVNRIPNLALQTLGLTILWYGILIAAFIPGSLITSFVGLNNLVIGQCVLLFFSGLFFWLVFPLFFTPHGIFVNEMKTTASIKASIRITRITFPRTGMFFIAAITLSKGLDFIWQIPADNSWMTIIGIAGHAFVTTGLLAASFVYYRDAAQFEQRLLQQSKQASFRDILRKV